MHIHTSLTAAQCVHVIITCSIDSVLGGGLQRGEVTELIGSSASGKTQVANIHVTLFTQYPPQHMHIPTHSLSPVLICVKCAINWSAIQVCLSCIQAAVEKVDGTVLILDTSGSISANRFADCLAARGLLEEV